MEYIVPAFIDALFNWRFRANSLKNILRKINTLYDILIDFEKKGV